MAYTELETHFARIADLEATRRFLDWDARVMMPEGGAAGRADQLATLATLVHEQTVAPQVGEWLDAAEAEELDEWQRANLREMRRLWTHATATPPELVAALTRARTSCEMTWRSARAANDFPAVASHLEEVVRLTRETARAKAPELGVSPYEALLDRFDPGVRTEPIDRLFGELEAALPAVLAQIMEAQAREAQARAPVTPPGPFPLPAQLQVAERLAVALGFDFRHGRLDVSAHGFCSGAPGDVRMAIRHSEDTFLPALVCVLHETGHALYERGLPAAWQRQPVGRARGMSMHESQSLLMEKMACRSRAFMTFAAPILRQSLGGQGPAWEPDNLYRLYTRVEPGFIRVQTDEVTYPAHVILRYRLERALVEDDLPIADLPAAWNQGMDELLGVRPPSDRLGCLQDIHWYAGLFGYFPTYTLGALTAAQLYRAACAAEPDIEPGLARGDVAPLLTWLRDHVHSQGSRWSTDELIRRATGAPLGTESFLAHLRARYLSD